MVTQNMRSDMVSDRGLVSASLSGGTAAKRTGQTGGFQDVMDRNLTKDKQDSNSVSNRAPVKKKDVANKTIQKPEQTVPEKTDTAAESQKADNNPLQVDEGDVIKEQLGTLVKKLQDVLGLSTEELVELMTQMGIGAADLCNQDNLMKLLLAASDLEDSSSILTDETLTGQFNEMLTALKEVTGTLEEEGISEDALKQWLSLEANMPKNPQQNDKPIEIESDNSAELMQISGETNVENDQTEPLVEVIHKGEAANNSVKAETEAEPQLAEENTQSDGTAAVTSVHAEDSEENLLLEKQESTNSKGNASSAIEEEEPKSQFEAFMTQLDKNSKAVTTEIVQGQNGQVTTVREIVNQVVSKIRMVIQPDMSSMELQLNPEHLGKVQLSVTAREGEMTAQFAVQNETAKAALESQIQLLRENLNNQGLKVEAIEVTVSDFSFSQSNGSGEAADSGESSRNHSRRQMNLDELNELDDDLSDDEAMAVRMMRQNGGSIDYTA